MLILQQDSSSPKVCSLPRLLHQALLCLSKQEVGKANTNSRGAGAASGQSRSGITFLAGAQVPPQMWHLPAPDKHSKLPSDHSIMECQPCQPHTTRPKFSSTSIFSRSRRAIKLTAGASTTMARSTEEKN